MLQKLLMTTSQLDKIARTSISSKLHLFADSRIKSCEKEKLQLRNYLTLFSQVLSNTSILWFVDLFLITSKISLFLHSFAFVNARLTV